MKGFINLLEVSIAALMLIIALMTFSIPARMSYERSELIEFSRSIYDIIESNFSLINKIIPSNIEYGMKVFGIPRSDIKICCNCTFDQTQWLLGRLNNAYMNGRWINFTIDNCALEDYDNYDMLLLVNKTDWNQIKDPISNWTNRNKLVFAVNDATTDQAFLEIFNLSRSSGSSAYNTISDKYDAKRIFSGVGFNVYVPATVDEKKQGYWRLWKVNYQVNKTDNYIEVQGADRKKIYSGENFIMIRNDGTAYQFKLKKIFDNEVMIQPVNFTDFFIDFSDDVKVTGNNVVGTPSYGTVIEGNNTLWMSYYEDSDDYNSLLISMIVYKNLNWNVGIQNGITISNLVSKCCDVPEFGRIDLILKYEY